MELASDKAFSGRVVALLWWNRRTQGWLAQQMGWSRETVAQKLRQTHGNHWQNSDQRRRVAEVLGTTLDPSGLPVMPGEWAPWDSNPQPTDYRPEAA